MIECDRELQRADQIIVESDDHVAAASALIVAGTRALVQIGGRIAAIEILFNIAGRVQAGAYGGGQHHRHAPGNA